MHLWRAEALTDERTIARHIVVWDVAGLAIAVLVTVALLALTPPGLMIEKHRSPYDSAATVHMVVINATICEWKGSRIYNFREALAGPAESKLAPNQAVPIGR